MKTIQDLFDKWIEAEMLLIEEFSTNRSKSYRNLYNEAAAFAKAYNLTLKENFVEKVKEAEMLLIEEYSTNRSKSYRNLHNEAAAFVKLHNLKEESNFMEFKI